MSHKLSPSFHLQEIGALLEAKKPSRLSQEPVGDSHMEMPWFESCLFRTYDKKLVANTARDSQGECFLQELDA